MIPPVQNLVKKNRGLKKYSFDRATLLRTMSNQSFKPYTSVRPASISDMSLSLYYSSVYEPNFNSVLIVDKNSTSGNYISTPKHREPQYKSPLCLKGWDFPCKISSGESLRSKDQMSKYDASYIVASSSKPSHTQIKGPLLRITENRRNEPDFNRSDNYSPVSVDSSSSEDSLGYEGGPEDNGSPPKLTTSFTPSSKSRPSLRPIMSPPPLVPCPTRGEARPLLTYKNFVEQRPGTSQASTNVNKEQIMDPNNKVSLHNKYRKLTGERLYKKVMANLIQDKKDLLYLYHKQKAKNKRLRFEIKIMKKKLNKEMIASKIQNKHVQH